MHCSHRLYIINRPRDNSLMKPKATRAAILDVKGFCIEKADVAIVSRCHVLYTDYDHYLIPGHT